MRSKATAGIIGGAIVIVLVVLLGVAYFSRSTGFNPFGGSTVEVRGIVGSEKADFFRDPEVIALFEKHDLAVTVDTAGSWEMGRKPGLTETYDFAFPASDVAGRRIQQENPDATRSVSTPFFSPIAIATFQPVLDVLAQNGVATKVGDTWQIDMDAYLALVSQDTRWNQLAGSEAYPSSRSVLFSSTDIRSSNSAGMYMALASYSLNGDEVVSTPEQASAQVDQLSRLFIGQGYAQSSSAGPFERYLSRGAGEAPLVVIYEGQFFAEQARENSRITDQMVLAYPSPTIFSTHTGVTFSEGGDAVMQLLSEDPEFARLLAEHGFRTSGPNAGVFDQVVAEHGLQGSYRPAGEFVDLAQMPSYEIMTYLLETIGSRYEIQTP
ncbi:hypothetical protein Bequi_02835 [Brachybacterium sp. JHP9]|uniref:Uncharacterized protein n=1 Tax=Brachybacterium equifaecis TaxID=2910770 RepID=A0ABT0QYP0_9MICO|nr:hypothetical protein [Brachybacterium equifaecis]MCL6422328.1 hypothetical protein [Brachybacterium equifaecis]